MLEFRACSARGQELLSRTSLCVLNFLFKSVWPGEGMQRFLSARAVTGLMAEAGR